MHNLLTSIKYFYLFANKPTNTRKINFTFAQTYKTCFFCFSVATIINCQIANFYFAIFFFVWHFHIDCTSARLINTFCMYLTSPWCCYIGGVDLFWCDVATFISTILNAANIGNRWNIICCCLHCTLETIELTFLL